MGDGNIGQSVDLHGRDMTLHGRHTGTGQLVFLAEGSGEPIAERLDLRLEANDILVPRLHVVDTTFHTTSDRVDIKDAKGVDYLRLYMPQATVLMDNTTPDHLAEADVQLHELDKAFQLLQEGKVSTTNAYVVHRRYTHQVLVPNFQQEHGVDSPLQYQRNSAAGYSEQHLSEGFTTERTAAMRGRMFVKGTAPEGWELAWYSLPASALFNLVPDSEDEEGEEGEGREQRNLGAMLWGN